MLSLIKFGASWCKPCQAIAPLLEQLDAGDGDLSVTSIDIDDNPQAAQERHVRSIPCLILFRDGKEISRHVGVATLSELKEFVRVARDL